VDIVQLQLKFDAFTKIPFDMGTIQNISNCATVEIALANEKDTGLILSPGEKYEWTNATIYARSNWGQGELAKVAVLKLINGGGGGSEPEPEPPEDEIATDEEVDEVLDEVFGDDDQP
jgi:hypothetical protein